MKISLLCFCFLVSIRAIAQDHGHLNIGAANPMPGEPLIFANRELFETDANYVKTLTLAASGTYAGYYQGNLTIVGLAATELRGGPEEFAAALGAQIHAQLVAVDGPPDGEFAFWESGATSPTFSLSSGSTGTNTWRVSENDGSPDSDPYGHIHGRRFTVNKPGIYTVSFRAIDMSTNGLNGGPIHPASSVVQIYFQAGANIKSVSLSESGARVIFSAPVGNTWVVEGCDNLTANAEWTTLSSSVVGDDYFHEFIDENPPESGRFYRLRGF